MCDLTVQAHSTMHEGHPCSDISGEYFQDGITNGAAWYSVDGEGHIQTRVSLAHSLIQEAFDNMRNRDGVKDERHACFAFLV